MACWVELILDCVVASSLVFVWIMNVILFVRGVIAIDWNSIT